ncbi:MAG: sialidase family protein [Pyrinomonadaceae bacterium]
MSKIIVKAFAFLIAFLVCAISAKSADLIEWGDTVALETERPASWARMVKLKNGDWLAAYAVFGDPDGTRIRIKKSTDNMRSWSFLTEFGEKGRNLDNANLIRLSGGDILLSMRSLTDQKSYRVQVCKSSDGGRNFSFLSVIDANEKPLGEENVGVWEPFLIELSPKKIAAFYANEMHSRSDPSFSQTISERISTDGGRTWGEEIRAVAEAGAARPGEPNVIRLPNKKYLLFYEVCGSEDCAGHFSVSDDGETWSKKIGPEIPDVFQNPQGIALDDRIWIVTSNNAQVIYTTDGGKLWKKNRPAFKFSSWGAFYRTDRDEIALVTGTKNEKSQRNKLMIRFGKFAPPK